MDSSASPTLAALCQEVLGGAPERIETLHAGPGGRARGTCRVHVGGTVFYATRRANSEVTEKEARILASLGERGAPTSRLLAYRDGWLVQTSVGAERLAQTLSACTPSEASRLLRAALKSLQEVHIAGRAAGLGASIPAFAHGPKTAERLLQTLAAVGTLCQRDLPPYDCTRLAGLVAMPGGDFIKWDARPGNAAVDEDGIVRWFDWQHANRRHVADDLVWLLCDEFVPAASDPATLLLETADAWQADLDRVLALAVCHVGLRLYGILSDANRLATSWEACLENDWLGSRESAQRLCERGASMAGLSELTKPLADWFGVLSF